MKTMHYAAHTPDDIQRRNRVRNTLYGKYHNMRHFISNVPATSLFRLLHTKFIIILKVLIIFVF